MRKFPASSLLVGAATAGAITLGASAAFAAGAWSVGNPNPDGSFSASLKSGGTVVFRDTKTGAQFTCTVSTINGSAPSGTVSNPVATITNGTFTNCSGPLGSTGSASMSSGGLNAVTYDATTDTVTGNITGISANLTIKSLLGTCTGTVTGSIGTTDGTANTANGNVTYDNKGTLTIKPDATPFLEIGSASGACAGLVNSGDPVTFQATYVVTPVITVTPA